MVYALIFTVTMTAMWWSPSFGAKLDWVSFGKTLFIWRKLLSRTFNTPPLSPSVTMNKRVNRIFQSSCGVLLSQRPECQETGCQLAALTEREVTSNALENSDDPRGSSTSRCLSAAWCLCMYSTFIATLKSLFYNRQKQTNKPALCHLVRGTVFEKKMDETSETGGGSRGLHKPKVEGATWFKLTVRHPNWFSSNLPMILTGLFKQSYVTYVCPRAGNMRIHV